MPGALDLARVVHRSCTTRAPLCHGVALVPEQRRTMPPTNSPHRQEPARGEANQERGARGESTVEEARRRCRGRRAFAGRGSGGAGVAWEQLERRLFFFSEEVINEPQYFYVQV